MHRQRQVLHGRRRGLGREATTPRGKFLYCADTLEELCDYMGMEEGVKANTLAAIEKWNAAHDAGIDTEFGRDPETMCPSRTAPSTAIPAASA